MIMTYKVSKKAFLYLYSTLFLFAMSGKNSALWKVL